MGVSFVGERVLVGARAGLRVDKVSLGVGDKDGLRVACFVGDLVGFVGKRVGNRVGLVVGRLVGRLVFLKMMGGKVIFGKDPASERVWRGLLEEEKVILSGTSSSSRLCDHEDDLSPMERSVLDRYQWWARLVALSWSRHLQGAQFSHFTSFPMVGADFKDEATVLLVLTSSTSST